MSDVLRDLVAMFGTMPAEAKREADNLLHRELKAKWLPNPGPQTQAYYCQADLLLYGGAAGGGKTDLLIGLALHEHRRSVMFRRAYVDLTGFEERLLEIRGGRSGYNASDMVLHDEEGRVLEFGALEKPGAELSWQGRPHDLIGFDEGAQLPEAKVRFVLGWARSATPGQRVRAVIASNPPMGGEGEWLVAWFAPWLDPLFPSPAESGELRWCVTAPSGAAIWVPGPGYYVLEGELHAPREASEREVEVMAGGLTVEGVAEALEAESRTFIPARLDDNPFLRGTGYRAKLQSLPEPMRSQLIKGDFMAGKSDDAWQVIPSAWIAAAQARWKPRAPHLRMVSLGVDPSGEGPDDAVLAPLYGSNFFDELVKVRGVDKTDGASMGAIVIRTLRDRANVNIDATGGWAGGTVTHLTGAAGMPAAQINKVVFSERSNARSKDGTFTMLNIRSELWWAFREALDPESGLGVALPPDRRLAAQLGAPTYKIRGTAIVIEQKAEVRKRLGTSTDDADAVIVAWHRRETLALSPKPRPRQDVA